MSKLYPPHLEGVLPAFSGTGSTLNIKIPFGLNRAVSKSEIKGFALKVKNITANMYITQTFQTAPDKFSLNKNPYVIFPVEKKFFQLGQYYKVQIAFINQSNETGYFSSVGTIKYAGKPTVTIAGLKDGQDNNHMYSYTGEYIQDSQDTSEKLYQSRFLLLDTNSNTVQSSGWILHNSLNDTAGNSAHESFTFTKALTVNATYYVQWQTESVSGLRINSAKYRVADKNNTPLKLPVTLQAYADEEDGFIDVFFRLKKGQSEKSTLTGYYTLSRMASNASNQWVELATFTFNKSAAVRHLWRDFNIEQGITYTYAIQKKNDSAGVGSILMSSRYLSNKCTGAFLDCFISDGTRQLKIRFNSQISTFRKTILENKSETIGGKYPFVFRNGQVNYREIGISGLISYQMDDNNKFLNRKNKLGLEMPLSDQSQANITAERIFREEVEKWLTNGENKLFRSPTEGNCIVRLLDVTLSPENGVNRMLYNFSCSACEIADYNIASLKKYNLLFTEPVTNFIDIELEQIRFDGGVSGTLPPFRDTSSAYKAAQALAPFSVAADAPMLLSSTDTINNDSQPMLLSFEDEAIPAFSIEDNFAVYSPADFEEFPQDDEISMAAQISLFDAPLDEDIVDTPSELEDDLGNVKEFSNDRVIPSTESNFIPAILPSGLSLDETITKFVSFQMYGIDTEFNKTIVAIPSYIDAGLTIAISAIHFSRIVNANSALGELFKYDESTKTYLLYTKTENPKVELLKNEFLNLINKKTYIGGYNLNGEEIILNGTSKIYSIEIQDALPGMQFKIDNELFLITKTGYFYSEFDDGIETLTIPTIGDRGIITYTCTDDAASIFSEIDFSVSKDIISEQFIGNLPMTTIDTDGTIITSTNIIDKLENVKNKISTFKLLVFKQRPIELLYRKNGLNYKDMECTQLYTSFNPLAIYAICKPRNQYNYDNILFSQYLIDAFIAQGYYVDNDGQHIKIFTGLYEDGQNLSNNINNISLNLNYDFMLDNELLTLSTTREFELNFSDSIDQRYSTIRLGSGVYCELSYKMEEQTYTLEQADMSIQAAKLAYLMALEQFNQQQLNPPSSLTQQSVLDFDTTVKTLANEVSKKYLLFLQLLTFNLKKQ